MRGLLRALLARCPVCGARRIWVSFGQTVERCPECGYAFSREEGYWAGALIINMTIAIILFVALFVGGMVMTWPDVPWNGLLVVTVAAMALGPVVFYRQSKMVWVWMDQRVHPYQGDERDWERG